MKLSIKLLAVCFCVFALTSFKTAPKTQLADYPINYWNNTPDEIVYVFTSLATSQNYYLTAYANQTSTTLLGTLPEGMYDVYAYNSSSSTVRTAFINGRSESTPAYWINVYIGGSYNLAWVQ